MRSSFGHGTIGRPSHGRPPELAPMTTPASNQPGRRQLANAIRFLAADAVEAAKSGHPGMPMGMADIAEVLWNDYLSHNPNNPKWFNRDRFVLSNGHGSMLQYALLHLSGYDLPLEELKNFRQLHSKTAGHPEHSETPGVETTTGPLGPGLRQCGRLRAGRKTAGAALQPSRVRPRRPPHLGVHGRRLPDGRHLARSRFAGRHLGPGQAGRVLGRQQHLHRRQHRRLVHRRHAGALRGLRLAGDPQRQRPRSGRNQDRHRHRAEGVRQADPDLLPHHDRFRLAQQAGQGIQPRRAAGQGRTGRHARAAGMAARPVRDPGGRSTPAGAPAAPDSCAKTSGMRCSTRYAARIRRRGRRTRAPLARRTAGRFRRRPPMPTSPSCRPKARWSLRARPRRWPSKPSRRCCRN